ncbi:hypothetical protein Asd1617_04002 [Shigella dysenteriae 1617]|uniref:Uncharacterized protein n=1 Tax=Shigella dysenteriae 1617 TaxID=754093 RepID=A0A0A6ZRC9_SHIDY|nr:hypothetical protein Asd1617_01538 [Shigella dysenteriae 1617]AHA66829.1 hypothetical protein Asd1617_04002 [Shigella dysenteriae 1617]
MKNTCSTNWKHHQRREVPKDKHPDRKNIHPTD